MHKDILIFVWCGLLSTKLYKNLVPADTHLFMFGAVPYAVPNQELFKRRLWRMCVLLLLVPCPHPPRLQSSSTSVAELPFPFSTLISTFCMRGVRAPLLPGPLVLLHCFLPVSACCLTWGTCSVHLHTKLSFAPNPRKAPFNHAEFHLIFNNLLRQIFFHSWLPDLQHQWWENLLDHYLTA